MKSYSQIEHRRSKSVDALENKVLSWALVSLDKGSIEKDFIESIATMRKIKHFPLMPKNKIDATIAVIEWILE
jgi:hypothetical protein